MYRDELQPEFLSSQQPRMARHDHAVRIDDNRLPPTELLDAPGDLIDSGLRDLAGVAGVWNDLLDGPLLKCKCEVVICFAH